MPPLIASIEAGGTKFVCAIGSGPHNILAEARFPTTTPAKTIERCIQFFDQQSPHGSPKALGIASFGPVGVTPGDPHFGFITSTPKPGWQFTDLLSPILTRLGNIPHAFDTDVNGAALAELKWGAAKGCESALYYTIGTGIGGGFVHHGRSLKGLLHPEMGHVRIPQDRTLDSFSGVCPFHGNCFEGLASGTAIRDRWSQEPPDLAPDHPAWELESTYIALAVTNSIYTLSPERIILGGGVMEQAHLFPMIRKKIITSINGYLKSPAVSDQIKQYIVPPALGNRAGVLGGIALGLQALQQTAD